MLDYTFFPFSFIGYKSMQHQRKKQILSICSNSVSFLRYNLNKVLHALFLGRTVTKTTRLADLQYTRPVPELCGSSSSPQRRKKSLGFGCFPFFL